MINLKTPKDYSELIYICRGIGIILVVFAHTVGGSHVRYIYLFHMPLFFLLSGISFQEFERNNQKISKTIRTLFIPTIISSLIISLTPLATPECQNSGYPNIAICAKFLYGPPGLSGAFSPYWFIFSIFFCQLIGLIGRSSNKRIETYIAWIIFVTTSLAIAFNITKNIPAIIFSSLFGLLFFLIGKIYSKSLISHFNGRCMVLLPLIILFTYRHDISLDMAAKNYGLPVLSVIIATYYSTALIWIVRVMPIPVPAINILKKIGKSSLFILLYHQAVQLIAAQLIPGISPLAKFAISILLPISLCYAPKELNIYTKYLGIK